MNNFEMEKLKSLKIKLIFLFLFLYLIKSMIFPCTMILVGKGATKDGSVLLAHNNDLAGDIASNLQIIPSAFHPPGSKIDMKNRFIPQVNRTFRMLVMNCYYGYSEGDAKAVNEFGVAIAGGVSLMDDRSDFSRRFDPLDKNGVSGHIRYIALERAKTARQCVEILGGFYTKYGISYLSGVGVGDYNEVWYIEAGGGKNWVAVKVPDDNYLVAANGYRIGIVDFNDKKNFIYPGHLYSFVKSKGLMIRGKGEKFNFAKTFGGKRIKSTSPYYNSRRVWRVQSLFNPQKKRNSDDHVFPLSLKAEKKIGVQNLINVLRDYYKETKYNPTLSGNPDMKNINRGIGILDTVHTSVIQLNGALPVEVGAVIWGGPGSSYTTPFFPFYFGINKIDKRYSIAGEHRDNKSAFWIFRKLNDRLKIFFSKNLDIFLPRIQFFEKKMVLQQKEIINNFLKLKKKNKKKAVEYLTDYINLKLSHGIELAQELVLKVSKK